MVYVIIMQKDELANAPLNMEEFNLKLIHDDISAWRWLHLNAKLYFKRWCNEENIEVMWTAENDKPYSSVENIYILIINNIKSVYLEKRPSFDNISALKIFIHEIFIENMNNGFKSFFVALKRKINSVWFIFHERMSRLLIIKIYMKQKMPAEDSNEICTSTLTTFSDKMQDNNLEFENSKALKSYVYCIADLKIKEYFTEISRRQNRFERTESYDGYDFLSTDNYVINKDNTDFVSSFLSILDKIEYEILVRFYYHGFELKEIADDLEKTPENIRQIKFRALEKLKKYMNNSNI